MQITTPININSNPCGKSIAPSFKGHTGFDIIKAAGKTQKVTTETAFFREYDSLKYVINYINDVFKNVKEKRFIVGGCSSGEEVWSLKMLMKDTPVKILGFDLSPRQIDDARKGIYDICKPKREADKRFLEKYGTSGYNDYYLGMNKNLLPEDEKEKKEMFDSMFAELPPKNQIIMGLTDKLRKIFDISFLELEKIRFKLRDLEQKDCSFVVGDMNDIFKVNNNNKNELFCFRNAFYHITGDNTHLIRVPLSEDIAKPKVDPIIKGINNSLKKNGLFLMGERENEQGGNVKSVCISLLENGFTPIKRNNNLKYPNIWIKTKDLS